MTVAAHMPLTDPDYLKTLRKEQNEMYEARAQMRMNIIVAAETGYAAKSPDQGYTCAMANLFTGEPAAGQEQPAAYYDPGQGSEEWNGYHFALSGCGGNPATKYRVTAVPTDSDAETKTFCSDQSGTLRFVIGEKVSSCFSQGQVLDSGPVRSETDE